MKVLEVMLCTLFCMMFCILEVVEGKLHLLDVDVLCCGSCAPYDRG